VSTCRVVEVTAERGLEDPPEIPWHLAGPPGSVQLQLRTTLRRVAVGAGLARDSSLLEAVRALPGLPALVTSPAGGTFIVGGAGWLGLCAIGVPPEGRPLPLDWMMGELREWLAERLGSLGLGISTGRVDGAWCPGFSDIAVGGRKLAGLGFRVTRDWVVMRGVMSVEPITPADAELLTACHRLIGVAVDPGAATSLVECTGDRSWTVARAIEHLRAPAAQPPVVSTADAQPAAHP
jgi:hypothetical protein